MLTNEKDGFRRKRSCESQLTTTLHSINKLADSGECVDAVVLDFSKAFDKVSHPKLIYKLKSLGINSQLILWIEHWLNRRSQIVVVNGLEFSSAPTTPGVPQGSVLGPLLFLIYINDITQDIKHQVRLFADDTLLFGVVTDDTSLQEDLDTLAKWAKTWQMEFNPRKCEVIHFNTTRHPRNVIHSYTLQGETLKVSTKATYLGIVMSNDLSWEHQVIAATNKSSSVLGMLRRQLRETNSRTRLTLYKSLIRPVLDYASTAWSPHHIKHKKSLEQVQRRAVRWILNLKREDSVTNGCEILGLETIEERMRLKDARFLEDIRTSQIDIDISDYISQQHQYDTRTGITQQYTKSSPYYHSFFIRTIRNTTI